MMQWKAGLSVPLTLLLFCLTACLCSCRGPRQPSEPHVNLPATNELHSIRCFAVGGVGVAGLMSEGEAAFRTVLASTNSLEYFKATLTNGTTEAKLYALLGIRLLSPPEFDAAAAPLLSSRVQAVTMSGCLMDHERASTIVARIKRGAYDSAFREHARNRVPG
jgi:hypothetical protein